MSSIQNSIKIFARIKPTAYKPIDYEVSHRDCLETDEFLNFSLKGLYEDGYINNKQEHYSYRFTQIFDRHCGQSQIFDDVAKPVINSALEGYNGTVFVYGQTGSGKTFTMTGSRETYNDRGVIPRTLQYVFEKFRQENSESRLHTAFISYLEIYNEGGYDLLHSGDEYLPTRLEELSKVTIMEDGNQHMHLRNLTVHPVNSEEEALHLLYLGDRNRTVAETPLNEASTRSHCIFTVHIDLRSTTSSMVRRSKIHLVDLAGSERIANSNISGQLLCEARHINLALHYLEQVIVALGDAKRSHIPYRNSMMTSILRDSLGGNCMTSMIATLSAEPKNVMESLSTCRFAQRVALVTNAATKNEELDPQLMIASLKQEIKRLKEMLMSTSVKPITESTAPLTEEEYSNLIFLLDQFISDGDPNSVLAVEPDMRIIQACFQILKATLNGDSNNSSKSGTPVPAIEQPTVTNEESGFEDLSQIIKSRDSEIKELVEMLRRERLKSSVEIKMDCNDTNIESVESDASVSKKLSKTDGSSEEFESKEIEVEGTLPEEEEQILKERNISVSMRKELHSYISNHHDRKTMEQMRTSLVEKRDEVQSIEHDIKTNTRTMMSLKDILESSKHRNVEHIDQADFSDVEKALLTQQRLIQFQENRLVKTQEQMTETVNGLKAMYDKLLMDFEFDRKGQENKVSLPKEDKTPFGEAFDMFKKSERESDNSKSENSSDRNTATDGNSSHSFESESGYSCKYSTAVAIASSRSRVMSSLEEIGLIQDRSPGSARKQGDRSSSVVQEKPISFVENFDSSGDTPQMVCTGDPIVDAEIINFYQMRRNVIKTINSQWQISQSQEPQPQSENCMQRTYK